MHLPIRAAREYDILCDAGLFANIAVYLKNIFNGSKVYIISDDIVNKLYASQIKDNLISSGYQVCVLEFLNGEKSKNTFTKEQLETELYLNKCDRHSLIIALGGGVVGDLVGFVAATYMRGIPFVQIPTTMLSMIDSSVGGKTAINTQYAKNIIGAFWQPSLVLMDINALNSLSDELFINGLFEAIKIFLTSDKNSFDYLITNLNKLLARNLEVIKEIIYRAVRLKAMVVEADEEERNLRMILNFGHTLGHAIEKSANYELLHGVAIAYGMLLELRIAYELKQISLSDVELIEKLLAKFDVDYAYLSRFSAKKLIEIALGDKKNKQNAIFMVQLQGIGKVKNIENQVAFATDIDVVRNVLMTYCKE